MGRYLVGVYAHSIHVHVYACIYMCTCMCMYTLNSVSRLELVLLIVL